MQQNRQTAYKLWISDILKGIYSREEGEFGLNYVLVKDKKVARVNLIGTFSDIYRSESGGYIAALLDDGFGSIRCKNWNEDSKLYENVSIGTIVLVVGKIREQNGEMYIVPEIVRIVEPIWLKIRNMELTKLYGKPERVEFEADVKNLEVVEEVVSGNDRQKIIGLIDKNGSSDGIDYDALVLKSKLSEDVARKIIEDLLKDGEIYEPRAGRLKILG